VETPDNTTLSFLTKEEVVRYYEGRLAALDRDRAASWAETQRLRKQVEALSEAIVHLTTRKVERQRAYIQRVNKKRGLEKQARGDS
jgi:hypothetical protein